MSTPAERDNEEARDARRYPLRGYETAPHGRDCLCRECAADEVPWDER